LLLVVLALLGFGVMLRAPLQKAPPPPPPPLRAEIYELPGKVGPKPRPKSEAMTRAAPKPATPATPPKPAPVTPKPKPEPKPVPPAVVHTAPAKPAPAPEAKATAKPPIEAKPAERHGEIAKRAIPKPRPKPPVVKARPKPPPAESEPPKHLDWAQLNAQVNDAVTSTVDRRAEDRIRDPHSLVARYYLASVLSKLERVGQLTYQASMVGQAAVAIVIGPQGELLDLRIAQPSGMRRIDDYAQQIVRMSVPFAPFPADMEKQMQRISIIVHMDFQGYRDVQAN
jgi:protein TonB